MEKAKHIGDLRICYSDYNESRFNESVDCTFAVWDKPNETISMEFYWSFCRQFAAAMGFGESTITEWFGDY